MKCSCCGKKKKLFESFEDLDKDICICVNCSKILYKYQDAIKDKDFEQAKEILKEIDLKKGEKKFTEWFCDFQKRIGVPSDNKIDNEKDLLSDSESMLKNVDG